jgi:hypothetical protein
MVDHNNYAADTLAREFGVDVTNKMVNVQARLLPPPMVNTLLDYHFDIYTLPFYQNINFLCCFSSNIMILEGRNLVYQVLASGT